MKGRRMSMNVKSCATFMGVMVSFAALATDPVPAETTEPASALPAMSFYGSIANDELFELVSKSDQFTRIDKELYGSPLHLRVMHSLQPTSGGKATGLLSAIFSGGTLGLLPVVTNNSLVVTYEVRVHGRELVSYSYQRSFTRAVNIWAKDETYGLGKDGLEWLKSTATEFTAAAASDAKLTSLKKEYERYFGAP
ncbi:MAG TPA: hypothetical protein VFS58_13180 [Steroidobacteraceae bacterium]|nr:hypothetical protein [Steroidobacteraceae bacterium]